MEPQLADAGPFHARNAWDQCQALGKSRAIGFDIDHIAATQHFSAELRHRSHERNMTAAEQRHTVTHALHPFEQVGGQEYGDPLPFEAADDREQFSGRVRIETRCRLVEDGDLARLHQDLGQAESLPHAARERADAIFGGLGQANARERVGDPRPLGFPKPISRAV